MRSSHFIYPMAFLSFWGCVNVDKEVQETHPEQGQKIETIIRDSVSTNFGWKRLLIGDSIKMEVPQVWQKVESERFSLKADCEKQFCENVVVYTINDLNQYTKMELGETFVKSLSSNYDNFKLIHSEISTPDSLQMSFDYLLSSHGLKLGGTTYIYIRGDGNLAVVFSFMGYNGPNGDYVTVRETITKIVETIEFQ